jgi:phosphatidylglycerophosphate synthase
MLDGAVRRLLDPWFDRAGRRLANAGIHADLVTAAGFVLGAFSGVLIAAGAYRFALALILASRLCDGLDGAVARHGRSTDRGGYLDIVLDFAFYGLVPLGFVLAHPEVNALPGAVLLFAFYVNGSSFLAYAVMAEKRQLSTRIRGAKSLYFTTGLAEATETIVAFCIFCLLPERFPLCALAFAVLCLVTALARIMLALRVFSPVGEAGAPAPTRNPLP